MLRRILLLVLSVGLAIAILVTPIIVPDHLMWTTPKCAVSEFTFWGQVFSSVWIVFIMLLMAFPIHEVLNYWVPEKFTFKR